MPHIPANSPQKIEVMYEQAKKEIHLTITDKNGHKMTYIASSTDKNISDEKMQEIFQSFKESEKQGTSDLEKTIKGIKKTAGEDVSGKGKRNTSAYKCSYKNGEIEFSRVKTTHTGGKTKDELRHSIKRINTAVNHSGALQDSSVNPSLPQTNSTKSSSNSVRSSSVPQTVPLPRGPLLDIKKLTSHAAGAYPKSKPSTAANASPSVLSTGTSSIPMIKIELVSEVRGVKIKNLEACLANVEEILKKPLDKSSRISAYKEMNQAKKEYDELTNIHLETLSAEEINKIKDFGQYYNQIYSRLLVKEGETALNLEAPQGELIVLYNQMIELDELGFKGKIPQEDWAYADRLIEMGGKLGQKLGIKTSFSESPLLSEAADSVFSTNKPFPIQNSFIQNAYSKASVGSKSTSGFETEGASKKFQHDKKPTSAHLSADAKKAPIAFKPLPLPTPSKPLSLVSNAYSEASSASKSMTGFETEGASSKLQHDKKPKFQGKRKKATAPSFNPNVEG